MLYLSFSCSPCYYCVPCSCVRPGIQCGLSVRGTFRVSQTVPAPCAPSHCLASCCGCLWGLLQPASNIPTSSSESERFLPISSYQVGIIDSSHCVVVQPMPARLKDFPECTTLCSHCRHRRLQRSILKPPLLSFPHSQPYASRHPLLTRLPPVSGGHR